MKTGIALLNFSSVCSERKPFRTHTVCRRFFHLQSVSVPFLATVLGSTGFSGLMGPVRLVFSCLGFCCCEQSSFRCTPRGSLSLRLGRWTSFGCGCRARAAPRWFRLIPVRGSSRPQPLALTPGRAGVVHGVSECRSRPCVVSVPLSCLVTWSPFPGLVLFSWI